MHVREGLRYMEERDLGMREGIRYMVEGSWYEGWNKIYG